MIGEEYERECAQIARLTEELLFRRATDRLPERAEGEPFHSGAHSVRAFQAGFRLLGLPPTSASVLEIGFNLGHSSACFLALGAARVLSVEVRCDERVKAAARALATAYAERFQILFGDSRELRGRDLPGWPFSIAYIDGDHEEPSVRADIRLAREAGCRAMLLDDWYPHWGPGVRPAAIAEGLALVAIVGNTALCYESRATMEAL